MLLVAKALSKSFGGIHALDDFSVEIGKGEIVCLIGPNGAGKTTFFDIVSGFLKPDEGTVVFKEEEITDLAPHEICRKGIARTFQSVKPFRGANVLQNVLVGAVYGKSVEGKDPEAESLACLRIVGLQDKKDLPATALTSAEMKKLEIARALATSPTLLLLDEVMAAFDISEAESTVNLLKEMRDRAVSIIVVEHIMRLVTSVADRIVVLSHGKKIADGKPEEVVQDKVVVSAYLGEEYAQGF